MEVGIQCSPDISQHLSAVPYFLPHLTLADPLLGQHAVRTQRFTEVVLLEVIERYFLQVHLLLHHRGERIQIVIIEWQGEDVTELVVAPEELEKTVEIADRVVYQCFLFAIRVHHLFFLQHLLNLIPFGTQL